MDAIAGLLDGPRARRAFLLGPDHYLFADDPATAPQAIIHPDQCCTTPDGQEIPQLRSLGVRRWGNAADGATEVLTGTYHAEGEVSRLLLDALPSRLVGQPPVEFLTQCPHQHRTAQRESIAQRENAA